MDSEEETYVRMNDLEQWRAAEEKSKPVRTHAVAREETGSGRPLKLAAACLGLVCVALMTTTIAVSVQYVRAYYQLFRDLISCGSEYQQLLLRYQNLTNERDQLQIGLDIKQSELERMINNTASCPDGWRKFGCSCYFSSFPKHTTWGQSEDDCTNAGAELVIINNKEEMIFLNNLEFPKMFWIGLKSSNYGSNWRWTDGSSPKINPWTSANNITFHARGQMCAVFNRFAVGNQTFGSWSKEYCSGNHPFICEKDAQVPFLP